MRCEFCGGNKHTLAECPLPGAENFRREQTRMLAPGSERVSDEALIATMLFRMMQSHVATAERVLKATVGVFEPSDAEPTRELLDAISDVRERMHMLRRCVLSPIGREQAMRTMHDDREISELFVALEFAHQLIISASPDQHWGAAAEYWMNTYFLARPEPSTEARWQREYTGTFDPARPVIHYGSAHGPRSPHGDALLSHLRELDGPTHNLD